MHTKRESDEDLREALKDLDNSHHMVTSWEAKFIENVAYQYHGPLTPKQRNTAKDIIGKYDTY